jgi:hypothetical protein
MANAPANKYYRPVFATIRLEAIWTLRIGHLRGAGKVIKHVLKEVDTIIKQRYEPNRGASSGYLLQLTSLSIEQALDQPDQPSYPDW